MSDSSEGKSYFPIKVIYADKGEPEIVDDPSDLRSGIGFHVLECNADEVEKSNDNL